MPIVRVQDSASATAKLLCSCRSVDERCTAVPAARDLRADRSRDHRSPATPWPPVRVAVVTTSNLKNLTHFFSSPRSATRSKDNACTELHGTS
eukprot:2958398-Prymnesium_polylepis.1